MASGIPLLTAKGRDALKNAPPDMSALCRNILVQVDGKKSVEDITTMFRGLKGLEDAIERLFSGNFIQISHECKDLVKSLARQMLGTKSATLIKKIDDLSAKYGEKCWEHLDEVDKVARLFYGEVVADQLKQEIAKILRETKK
jgi:hypothetical protein